MSDSAIKFKTASGRYYVTYRALDGTYNVCEWPSERVLLNRDWLNAAISEAQHRESLDLKQKTQV